MVQQVQQVLVLPVQQDQPDRPEPAWDPPVLQVPRELPVPPEQSVPSVPLVQQELEP